MPFDYKDPWGAPELFPAGRPTDDSELTAALGWNLCRANGDESDLYRRLRSCVIDKKSLLCDLPAYGFGGTTRRALLAPTYQEAREQPQARPPVPSNGSLMRCAPVALRYHGDFKALVGAARRTSVITHTHPLAVECTVFYTIVLDRLLAGCTIQQSMAAAHRSLMPSLTQEPLVEYLRRGRALFDKPDEPDKSIRGGALVTLQIALWATANANNFRDGIEKAVGIGGDTDTYAAVAGGLLGAIHGLRRPDGIPIEWKSTMAGKGYETMMLIGYQLFQLRMSEYGA